MKQSAFEHRFVDAMPEELEAGQLYVSIRFRTAAHLCACGCGTRVVTPIKPAKWQLTFDGETVSLSPSIGRWQLPCRSHYWIRRNVVVWSRAFTDEEIDEVLRRDAEDLRGYYETRERAEAVPSSNAMRTDPANFFSRVWRRIKG